MSMRHWIAAALVAAVGLAAMPSDADAKRLGGSRSSGMQRQVPDKPMQKAPDATPAAGATTPASAQAARPGAAAAAQAPARRSWAGPLMGLAAGLGLAALASSLGLGEEFGAIIMMALLGLAAVMVVRWLMARRRGGASSGGLATAAAGAGMAGGANIFGAGNAGAGTATQRSSLDAGRPVDDGVRIGSALTPPLAVPGLNDDVAVDDGARRLPADFDAPAFERIAKTIFVRLQAANDEHNLDDLRAFTTPEMFAELKTDLLERGSAAQHTEVVSVNPTIVDFEDQGERQIVSVRYVGVVRESDAGGAQPFDEVWHLVKVPGSPAWRIAGIQQLG